MRVTVLGSGSFGTALANILAVNADEVFVWGREPRVIAALNEKHQNVDYLPGIELSPRIRGTLSLEESLRGSELVVVAIPSQATRQVMSRACEFLPPNIPIVTVAKGIENDTLLTMTEVLEDALPEQFHPWLAVLSGPSFAKELALRMPTVVTVASNWEKVALRIQKILHTDTFRTYTSKDVVGVQMGGALKNVIAIATGMADGLGLGHNAQSAIITRGLAEIARIAVHRGANPLTLSGLSGMGDLVLTCTGELSRNRRVGLELGRGRPLGDILGDMNQVAEGVKTAKSARDLELKTGLELPICHQVFCIAYEGKNPKQAVMELMTRQPRSEF